MRMRGGAAAPIPTQLSNGMTLINAPVESDTVCLCVVTRWGARDELPEESGHGRLVTSMFFSATAHRPTAQALFTETDGLGSVVGALAGSDYGLFTLTGRASHLARLTEILGDVLNNPAFAAEDLAVARKEWLDELDAVQRDPSRWVSCRILTTALDERSILSRANLPSRSVIAAATMADVRAMRGRMLDPARMAVIVAGGAQLSQAEAEEHLGTLRSGGAILRRVPAPWRMTQPAWIENIRPTPAGDIDQLHVAVAMPGMPENDPDQPAFDVLNAILSGGMSSRLFLNVRARKGLCYGIESRQLAFEDGGVFIISTSTDPDQGAQALAIAMRQVMDLAGEGRVASCAEVRRAVASLSYSIAQRAETALGQAGLHSTRWLLGRGLQSTAEAIAEVAAVTPEDVTRVAQRLVAGRQSARLVYDSPRAQGAELTAAVVGATL